MQSFCKSLTEAVVTACATWHVSCFCYCLISLARLVSICKIYLQTNDLVFISFLLSNISQVVGICTEELQAAQHWNGPAVLDLLRAVPP